MLVQQMENSTSFEGSTDEGENWSMFFSPMRTQEADKFDSPQSPASSVSSWISCIWNSAKACSTPAVSEIPPKGTKFERLLDGSQKFISDLFALIVNVFESSRIFEWPKIINAVWLTRIRSPIVQRLLQSFGLQLYYITRMLRASDDLDESRYDF